MGDYQIQPATGDWLSLKLISYYLVGYGLYAAGLSALSLVLGSGWLSRSNGLATRGFFEVMEVYGVVAAVALFLSWHRLQRRTPDATHVTRIALVIALPGTAMTALVALVLLFSGGWSPAFGMTMPIPPRPLLVATMAGLTASAANIVVLRRLYFTDHSDALLWEEQSQQMAEGDVLNFIEEEVELDLAAATDSVVENEGAPAVVEVK